MYICCDVVLMRGDTCETTRVGRLQVRSEGSADAPVWCEQYCMSKWALTKTCCLAATEACASQQLGRVDMLMA